MRPLHYLRFRNWYHQLVVSLGFLGVLSLANTAEGQERWTLGLTGGALRSTLSSSAGERAVTDVSSLASPSAGVFVARQLHTKLRVESGFTFSARGARWTIPDGTARARVELKTLSGDFPLLLHGLAGSKGAWRFDITGGAMLSRQAGDQINEVQSQLPVGTAPLRFGSVVGIVGAQVRRERLRSLSFAIRYHRGLTIVTTDGSWKHRALQASINWPLLSW